MVGRFRVAMSTGNLCTGKRFEMPVPYTLEQATESINQLIDNGREYNFYAQYPYGPYKRFVGSYVTVIVYREA